MSALFFSIIIGNAAALVAFILAASGVPFATAVGIVFSAVTLLLSSIAVFSLMKRPQAKTTTFQELNPNDARFSAFLHDFNNGMCGILGPISLMQHILDTDPDATLKGFREELTIIKAQAEHLQGLVANPGKQGDEQVSAQPRKNQVSDLSGTVLIVDDNLSIRIVTGDIVRLCGMTPDFAETAKHAIELMKKKSYDLVILDYDMPVMNGRQAFPLIKKANPDVKIIVTSGYAKESVLDGAVLTNADAFIQKPYSLDQVADTLRSVMNGKRAIS